MKRIKFINCKIDYKDQVFQPRIETEFWVGKEIKELKAKSGRSSSSHCNSIIKDLKILVCDVDGVLTQGDIIINEDGKETKVFNVHDGLAINLAKEIGAKIVGVVGRDTGVTAQKADACIIVPCPDDSRRTPHTEDFQLIMDHLLVNLLAKLEKQDEE